ncbi:MAG: hypothetical protein ACSHYF_08930 [Verrucomicrobiaceae bacterium]
MKELWEQALLGHNLPFTILMGVVGLFWLLSVVGTFDADAFDVDFEADGDVDGGGAFGGVMRFVNAQDVPVMIILSLLALFMWLISIISNYYLNPAGSELVAFGLLCGNFVVSVLLVKFVTQPLRPVLRALKNDKEHQEPLIGSSGVVKSRVLDGNFGQCEVSRPKGAPALLNCRLAGDGDALVRGDEILVIDYDESDQKYLIKPLKSPSSES